MSWMSPEGARKEPLSIQADIYSFCCLKLETFREKVPWSRMNADEIRSMWQSEDWREFMLPVSSSAIPADFRDVLEYGLQPNRNDRLLELEYILWKLRRAAADDGTPVVLSKPRRSGRSEMSSSRFPALEPQVSMDESSRPRPEDQADVYWQPNEDEVRKAGSLSSSSVDRLSTEVPLIDLEEKSSPTPAQSSAPRQRNFQRLTRALMARKRVTFNLARNQTSDDDHPAVEVDRLRSVFELGSNPTGSPKNVDFTKPPFKRQSSLLAIKPASHLTECPTVFIPGPGHDEKEVGEEGIGMGGQPSSSSLLNGDIGFGGDRTNIGTQCDLEDWNCPI